MSRAPIVSRNAARATERAAPLIREGRWWDDLPLDFARTREPFELGRGDRLRVSATAITDVALRTAGASLVSALALPVGYHPLRLRQALRDLDFYGPIAERGDASAFFVAPLHGVRVEAGPARWFPRFEPEDGTCEALSFDSPFQPVNPAQHRSYLRHRDNHRVRARYWLHHDRPRPTILALHGFAADFYLINEWFFALPWFYRMGCDVLLMTLPFHGERQTRHSPFSGHGYFAGGPSRINEAAAQSVYDARVLVDWLLEARRVPAVGAMGVSLGAFTTALLAAAEPRLAFAVPIVPVTSLADLVLEWQPIGVLLNGALAAVRKDLRVARRMLAVTCPLTYPPALPRDRLMIVAGVGDRLAPPKHSRVLWDHWDRPRIHWFPGSHLLHMDRGEYMVEIARFLHDLDFLEPNALADSEPPPRSLPR